MLRSAEGTYDLNQEFTIRTRKPSESRVTIVLPFSTDKHLRDSYLNVGGGSVRIGLLLEDLDSLAGEIAYKHSEGFHPKRPVTIVTAGVDRIETRDNILPFFDLHLEGFVTWTGRSSMEICIEVKSLQFGEWKTCMTATFVMVAREKFNNVAAPVHKIEPETEREKELYRQAEKNMQRRKKAAEESLEKRPPNDEERDLIHRIFLKIKEKQGGQGDWHQWFEKQDRLSALSPSPAAEQLDIDVTQQRFIHTTVLQNTKIMFPQQRNIHNKIFGGYLLRQAYELAFACASIYCKSNSVLFLSLDDNAFLKPVEIGSIVSFTSAVVYTGRKTLNVRVEVEVLNPVLGTSETTNNFHFTFLGPIQNRVLPQTYHEACMFLEGRRVHEKAVLLSKSMEAKHHIV